MAQIMLQGMSFYAHHGYYTHERTRGNTYIVDVTVSLDVDAAALEDDLHKTVNYEVIYRICGEVMEHPCKLVETVAYRIAHEIRERFPELGRIEVRLQKLKPELGGPVDSAQIIYKLD